MIRALLSAVLLASCVLVAAGQDSAEVKAAVVVNETVVPLSVWHRFPEVSRGLPKPGNMPAEDLHDKQHDSHTYCYRFGNELLELFDSDFGLHTARLSRPKGVNQSCTPLKKRAYFEIAGARLSLEASTLPALPGFKNRKKDNALVFERTWQYRKDDKTCFDRVVSIEARQGNERLESITVMNWTEGGC